jgi:hypothetical protein
VKRLEEVPGEIVVGTPQFAEIIRLRRFEWEERHRRWEAEGRLREMQEKARKKEEAKRRAFPEEVEQWNLCNLMREYIGERERALENTMLESEREQKEREWMAWAKQYVVVSSFADSG